MNSTDRGSGAELRSVIATCNFTYTVHAAYGALWQKNKETVVQKLYNYYNHSVVKDIAFLQAYCVKLGLKPEIAHIYIALQTYGAQTMSQLARNSGIGRVQLYRLFDDLKVSGLVEVESRYKRSILHAAPITNLQFLVDRKEQELKDLRSDFAPLAAKFSGTMMRSSGTKVQFYEGMDGIKQMLWKQTQAKGLNRAILYDSIQHKTDLPFFERWVRQCNKRGLRFRGIIGDHFIHAQADWYNKNNNERLAHWEARRVEDQIFPITYSVATYDNVVLHYDWNNAQMFGIEIHNPEIARLQRKFFDLLWQQAEPVDDVKGTRLDSKETGTAQFTP